MPDHAPGSLSRRAAIKRGLAGVLAYGVAPTFLRSTLFGRTAPSNRITLGLIGNGLICASHVSSLVGRDDCRIIALCDVWRSKSEKTHDRIAKAYADETSGTPAKGLDIYAHYEELLARPDIDAVLVCTPDHWHAAISRAAMIAGKDVYSEKPLTLTIAEGRVLVNTARQYGRVLQTGTQQRSNKSFRKAAELVRNGMIGKLKIIRTRLGADFPEARPLPEQPIPADLDYDRWLGPTPWRPYNELRVKGDYGGGWRCFPEYGQRKLGDWGAHHFDIIQWALGMDESGPVEFVPEGWQGTKYQHHRYANGITVERVEDGSVKSMIEFYGSDGMVGVSRDDLFVTEPAELTTTPLRGDQTHLYASDNHEGDFLNCVRTRQRPIADVEIGHRSATVCHLSRIAQVLQRPIHWNPATEEIVGDPVAARMTDRPRRAPYAL
jgi:predicted dehydrogenase